MRDEGWGQQRYTMERGPAQLDREIHARHSIFPATNFGAMLMSLSRWSEAIGILEGVLPKLDQEVQSIVGTLIEQGRAQVAASSQDPVKATR